jgi:hypothetical protein
MWHTCFGKTIIMYKYVGVYIFVLMHNSFSMCYLGFYIIEIKKNVNLKKWHIFFEFFLQYKGWKLSTRALI